MNKKLLIFSLMVIFIFGYVIFEALKFERKFISPKTKITDAIITKIPIVSFDAYQERHKVPLQSLLNKGDTLLVHFWATWCAPCEAEFPELVEMMHKFKEKNNIKFLLVAVNDDTKKIKKFLTQFDLSLDSILLLEDKDNSHKEFGTYKMPETFVFSSEGSLVRKFSGQQKWSDPSFVDFLSSF